MAEPSASRGNRMHEQGWHSPAGGRDRPRGGGRHLAGASGGWLLVLAAAVLWGTTGTARALGPEDASPISVGAVRILLGAAALAAFAWSRRGAGRRGGGRWRLAPVLLGGAAMAAYPPAFFSAVRLTGVAAGTVIAIGSAPVAAGLLAWAVRGERPGRAWAAATAVAVPGGAVLALAGAPVLLDPIGILLALTAGTAYALYATVSKGLLDERDPVEVTAAIFGTGALLLLPVLAAYPPTWIASPRGALVALHLGIFATALSYVLFSRGLARIPVATAATITLAEPVTATLLGTAILGERLTAAGLAGAALVLVGLAILSRERPRSASS